MRALLRKATALLGFTTAVTGLEITFEDEKSVKSAASTVAYGLMKFYTGNNTGDVPGNLPDPYYWWEAGALFGTMIDYWWLTGDSSYNDITKQALVHQAGDTNDYMPENQTLTEGNDDQGFWAMAVMSAAEHKFPDPPDDKPGWLALTQAVFNEYVSRWDSKHCSGGLRWQIFTFNTGFDYKNSISNGCFFNIAARLARYTGNDTYADWAEKIWDWEVDAGLITNELQVFDGVTIGESNCSSTDTNQWTYNAGIYLHGAAVMYNITESDTWKKRVDGVLTNINKKFVKNNVIYEQFCEPSKQCNQDQQNFKGFLARWMAATTQMAPHTYDSVAKLLLSSAKSAVGVCNGSPATGYRGPAGTACGFSWLTGAYDGIVGVGPQMSALSIFMYTLVDKVSSPVTKKTGGTSKGDPNAGDTTTGDRDGKKTYSAITMTDKAGAGIVTFLIAAGVVCGTAFTVI
ncbi:hypothetical protein LCI18_004150 [Fusarium solani-melongenae]|uniref:Uncharacterized protein n=1 Tax=Fusarium solani subsp. cucurbitae TaxID=2747967 RepID=A0ACD3YWB7_FUSSC|nr:hypothetical protein LCI18_004150 [Fusarium solani-melongenae]